MIRKTINTFFWMVIFAAVTFCIIPVFLFVIVPTHIVSHMSDTSLEVVLWPLRLIFLVSPLVAVFLGFRGWLPGTKRLDVAKRSAGTTSKILALVVIIIVVLFTWGAWVAVQPFPKRPNISIIFLGYTNDAAGTRLAKFKLTNPNSTPSLVCTPQIEIKTPTNASGFEGHFVGDRWSATLDRGASGTFTTPPPTNQLPWRLSFYVYPNRSRGVKRIMQGAVSLSCLAFGPRFMEYFPDGGAMMIPYDISGHWIRSGKRPPPTSLEPTPTRH